MREALIVVGTGENLTRRISASEVDHKDFGKIFLCPECSSHLTLRQEHRRGGRLIPASFVHPPNSENCSKRIEFNISPSNSNKKPFDLIIGRGQNSKKLEAAFFRCLEYFICHRFSRKKIPSPLSIYGLSICPSHLREGVPINSSSLSILGNSWTVPRIDSEVDLRRQIQNNKKSHNTHKCIEELNNVFAKVLYSQQTYEGLQKFSKGKIASLKHQFTNESKPKSFYSKKKESKWWQLVYQKLYSKNLFELDVQELIDNHFSHVEKLSRYICRGLSDDGREHLSEIIMLGGNHLSLIRDSIDCTSLTMLSENPHFWNKAVKEFGESANTAPSHFIEIVLTLQFSLLSMFDWSLFPLFYDDTMLYHDDTMLYWE